MTLLVGIHSEEGAVIAADRQVTQGMIGTSSSKVRRINHNTIFAASGHAGLGQQVEFMLAEAANGFGERAYVDAMLDLQPKIQQRILTPGYAVAKQFGGSIPGCACVFGSVFQDGPALAFMDDRGIFTKLSEMQFICQGSGGANGRALLSSIWSLFYSQSAPSLRDAIFAAYATVQIAIEIRSPGVGFDADVCALHYPGGGRPEAQAREIPRGELDEHDEHIGWMKESLLSAQKKLSGKDGGRRAGESIPSMKNREQGG